MNFKQITQLLKDYYRNSPTQLALIITGLGMVALTILTVLKPDEKPELAEDTASTTALAEIIPEGKMLLPVELINGEALLSLIEKDARVDLYTLNPQSKKKQKIVSNIKIVKNSDELGFSVILDEEQSHLIPDLQQNLFAILKSKKSKTQKQVTKVKTKSLDLKLKGEEI